MRDCRNLAELERLDQRRLRPRRRAWWRDLAIGVFAALNQLNIAEPIGNGLFYAMLAIVAGSAIIAIGGGGIAPMRQKWEQAMSRMEEEAPKIKQEAQGSQGDIPAACRAAQGAGPVEGPVVPRRWRRLDGHHAHRAAAGGGEDHLTAPVVGTR